MGDLQGEFDFFIKNQQPTEEKKKIPSLPTCYRSAFSWLFFPEVPLSNASSPFSSYSPHYIYLFYPIERKPLWLRGTKVTST